MKMGDSPQGTGSASEKKGSGVSNTGLGWWPWAKPRHPTTPATVIPPGPTGEVKKLVISSGFISMLSWHIPAIISCIGTAVLLYLNLSEYTIGTEIGKTSQDTRNILGALQLAAKAHEITIVSSLYNIARQWVQQCLIDDGTLLGLVGAENSLLSISFLVSRELRAGFRYGLAMLRRDGSAEEALQQRKRGMGLLMLMVFFSLVSFLSSMAGPASAVLMIPRYDWFHGEDLEVQEDLLTQYPNIFIDPLLVGGEGTRMNAFALMSSYWAGWMLQGAPSSYQVHNYTIGPISCPITSRTVLGRSLALDSDWEGGTNLTSTMAQDIYRNQVTGREHLPPPKYRGSATLSVTDMTGIEVNIYCRGRRKVSCSDTYNADGGSDNPAWCYLSIDSDPSKGDLQSSRQLLLVARHNGSKEIGPDLWMTEGPRISTNKAFTESIIIVFDLGELDQRPAPLVVCSVAATLKTATVTSSVTSATHQFFLHDTLGYYDGISTIRRPPRTILYHENWLDFIHQNIDTDSYISNGTPPVYLDRTRSKPTQNKAMRNWAIGIIDSVTLDSESWWASDSTDAAVIETTVGGSFISMLLATRPSASQYLGINIIPSQVIERPGHPLPEDIANYTIYKMQVIEFFYQSYGYRLSTRTGIIGVIVLITHVVLVLSGSMRQCQKGSVIQAWGSIPEYITLSLGSNLDQGQVENTCAGIGDDKTLNKVVRIREVTEDHLELVVVSPDVVSVESKSVDTGKKYGNMGKKRTGQRKHDK